MCILGEGERGDILLGKPPPFNLYIYLDIHIIVIIDIGL